jgi:uncharacterized protein (TIGR03435 family)
MNIRTLLGTGLALAAACALAQSPPPTAPLSFEVASLKPAAPPSGRGMRIVMGGNDPGRLNYSNVSMRDLIRQAYQLKDYQITGPEWLDTERYELVAKLPDGAPKEQAPMMLQTLLAERFKMAVHREKKDLPAYALTVARRGSKMKEFVEAPEDTAGGPGSASGRGGGFGGGFEGPGPIKMGADGMPKMPAGHPGMIFMSGMGRVQMQGVPMSNFADFLSRQLTKPVVDETGLTAKYDIALNWTPEPGEGPVGMKMMRQPDGGPGGGEGRGPNDATAPAAPPLAAALQQQLGLRLEPKKLPVEMLVVDHAEKIPTEN